MPRDYFTKSMKVVWITGASSGIGEAIALEYASQSQLATAHKSFSSDKKSQFGVRLILSARRMEELQRVKERCVKETGIAAEFVECVCLDLLDNEQSHEKNFIEVLSKFGRVDVLVNNVKNIEHENREERDRDRDRQIETDRD